MNVQYDWRFFLRNVFNHRSNILKVALFGSILSIGFSCVYQIKYEAVVKLHSREGSNPNAMMAGKFGGAAEFLSGGSVRNNNEFYMEILRTRPVLNRIIEANNLKNHYKVTSAEKAQKKLLANLGVVLGRGNIINISVTDTSPTLSMKLANTFADELQQVIVQLDLNSSMAKRKTLYEKIVQAKKRMHDARLTLTEYETSSGAAPVEIQAMGLARQIESLDLEIIKAETRMEVIKQSETNFSPNAQQLDAEIKILKDKRRLLASHFDTSVGRNLPVHKNEVQLLSGDLLGYQQFYQYLIQSYQMTDIDGYINGASLEIVDPAVAPEFPRWSRFQVAVLGSLFSVICSILFYGFSGLLSIMRGKVRDFWQTIRI